MFTSNALPLPSNFAHEHRPLRLTSEAARPQPTGPCHFVLLHPSVQNQRCSCQGFHHNRAAPGNICDCGHQACYHLAQPSSQEGGSRESVSLANENALLERIKRLEETIQNEREIRESAFQRERQLWEREVRILREALAPFYKSEQEMRRKFVELEDRVEGNYDEQCRLKDRLVAVDDANMNMEKRVDELEQSRSKRRRLSRPVVHEDAALMGSSSDDRRVSSNMDARSVNSASSHALSPSSNGVGPPSFDPEEPRSSGILNLVEMTARSRINNSIPAPVRNSAARVSEEARSSGFLALDLAERFAKNQRASTEQPHDNSPPAYMVAARDKYSPPGYAQSDPDAPMQRRSPSFVPPNASHQLPPDYSPRKRKHPEHMALDLLADVSMASPLVR